MPPEGTETAAAAFERAIDVGQSSNEQPAQRAPATRARDNEGRFAQVAERPEPMFEMRIVEGDPETGDTSDGGDDPRLRARERELGDGQFTEREDGEAEPRSRKAPAQAERQGRERSVAESGEERGRTGPDDGHPGTEDEPEDLEADAAGDEETDEGPEYEITVDGQPQTVTLSELRDGYIRTATFHSRINKVHEHKQAVEQEAGRVGQLREIFINGLSALDHDFQAMAPAEPDWDKEFELDPAAAHRKQKEYQAYYAKLNQIRQQRAWSIQNGKEEQDRASAKYAVEQFTQFVEDHRKLIKDEPSLQRVVGGMRKTALNEGFLEHEVAGVYDRRMLNILFKAWMYDQGMAVRPQAAITNGQGRTLVPGSARPLNGSVGRRNIDEAQRALARTGKMEDATNFFQRLLR